MHCVFQKILLKPNSASHNNASWYTDTDRFLKHSPTRASLYSKVPAFQKIYLVFHSPSYIYIYVVLQFLSYIFKDFIYFIFREGKGRRKRGRETSVCGCFLRMPYQGPGLQPRHVPQTGNRIGDPSVPRPGLNPLNHARLSTFFSLSNHFIFTLDSFYVDGLC